MSSVRDVLAEDVINTDHVSLNIGQPLSKARTVMEQHRLRTIPVVDGDKFVGMLGYRDLIEKLRSDPSTTKIDSLVHTPPRPDRGKNLVELADLRINSGRKKFAVLGEHNRLEGVIGERELVYPVSDAEELQDASVDDVMTQDLITVTADERFETARKKMMEHNISRLPVVDDTGDLIGILSSLDTLRAMVPREQMQGGSRHKTGRDGQSGRIPAPVAAGDYKGHKDSLSDIPVRELMERETETELRFVGDGLVDALELMKQQDRREVIPVEDGKPVGIVTLKDVIKYVAEQEAVEALRVQLTGPDVPEEKRAVLEKVETAVRGGLGRVLVRPDELNVHVKRYEADGKRHKYSLNFKLSSKEGVTTVKTHGWNLLDAVDEGLEKLETVLKREKEKRIDEKRDQQRRGKYS